MSRLSLLWCTTLALAGCHLPEREAALTPLAENQPFNYVDLLARARSQATTALEAFYVDAWSDLESVAIGLEQTARLLPKSNNVPTAVKDRIGPETDQLKLDARKLGDAARAKDAMAVNTVLQRIFVRIRELRVDEKIPPPQAPPEPGE